MRIRTTWRRMPMLRISSPAGACNWISRGSPEQVIDGSALFGYIPREGENDADMGRRHAQEFFELLRGKRFAQPNPHPMLPSPPGLLRIERYSEGLRDRICWGAGSNAIAVWAARLRLNLPPRRSNLMKPVSRSISNKRPRFAPITPPGKRLATLALRAFLSAAVSSR